MATSPTFGGEKIRNAILEQLQLRKIAYQHFTHQEITPHLVAKEIGVDIHEGVKCLIMRGKKSHNNYLICVLGHQKVDMKALASLVEEKCEFEKVDSIQERFGLEVGGIPPFGNLLGLDVYFETGIQNCNEVIFSCGPLNESIRMKLADLILLILPRFAKLVK
ncbi:MAG: YbaK/EbsC family protein [Verrucomicrobia bacterium]|nr:YbaK/EbsC family protein [Verrucomicrobiota bacterium]